MKNVSSKQVDQIQRNSVIGIIVIKFYFNSLIIKNRRGILMILASRITKFFGNG